MIKKYPKVLIIGEPFNKITGGGITICNFFQDWPKDRLAVIAGNNIWHSDFSFCHNLYKVKTISPFGKISFLAKSDF